MPYDVPDVPDGVFKPPQRAASATVIYLNVQLDLKSSNLSEEFAKFFPGDKGRGSACLFGYDTGSGTAVHASSAPPQAEVEISESSPTLVDTFLAFWDVDEDSAEAKAFSQRR